MIWPFRLRPQLRKKATAYDLAKEEYLLAVAKIEQSALSDEDKQAAIATATAKYRKAINGLHP